jgi:transmembrane sensor
MNRPSDITDDRIDAASHWCLQLADGRLDGDAHARFQAWLDEDPRNRAAFDTVARTWQALDASPTAPSLIAMREEALSHYARRQSRRWKRTAGMRRPLWAAAAACFLLLVAGVGLWFNLQPEIYRTGIGERQLVRLEDGSQLSLDADTQVEVHYSRDRRQLALRQGRARFQVAHDPLRPFSVSAGSRTVVATGTEFSVEMLAAQVHVILYEGSVEVLSRDAAIAAPAPAFKPSRSIDADGTRDLRLVPGQELVAGLDAADARVRAVDAARTRGWESGQLTFNDEPLSQAIERMNRYAGAHALAIGDDASAALRISGTFTAGDNEAFIEGVTGVFPVTVRVDGARYIFVQLPGRSTPNETATVQ